MNKNMQKKGGMGIINAGYATNLSGACPEAGIENENFRIVIR